MKILNFFYVKFRPGPPFKDGRSRSKRRVWTCWTDEPRGTSVRFQFCVQQGRCKYRTCKFQMFSSTNLPATTETRWRSVRRSCPTWTLSDFLSQQRIIQSACFKFHWRVHRLDYSTCKFQGNLTVNLFAMSALSRRPVLRTKHRMEKFRNF